MTRNTVISAQCMVLAAAYLFYLIRPFEAWTLLSSTSTKLQLLRSVPGRVPPDERELSERVYWNASLFESDLRSELDLPHSGIVQLEENVGLSVGFREYDTAFDNLGDDDVNSLVVGRDELWYFLAEIALRLLDRVSQLIYSKDAGQNLLSLGPVVAEASSTFRPLAFLTLLRHSTFARIHLYSRKALVLNRSSRWLMKTD